MPASAVFKSDYAHESLAAGRMLGPKTISQYRTMLNKLAAEGWDTPESLLKNQEAIVAYIAAYDTTPRVRRLFTSAIWYALNLPKDKVEGLLLYGYSKELKGEETAIKDEKRRNTPPMFLED